MFRQLSLAGKAADEQAANQASVHVMFRLNARSHDAETNPLQSFVPLSGCQGANVAELSRESQFVVGVCVFFPELLTRPTGVLGAPLKLKPARRYPSPPKEDQGCAHSIRRWRIASSAFIVANARQESMPDFALTAIWAHFGYPYS